MNTLNATLITIIVLLGLVIYTHKIPLAINIQVNKTSTNTDNNITNEIYQFSNDDLESITPSDSLSSPSKSKLNQRRDM